MQEKKETIQFRVDKELKTQFFELARKRGIPPSGLLRDLIRTAIEYDNDRFRKTQKDITSLNWILLYVLKYLHKQALKDSRDSFWENYLDSGLVEFLDELLMETSKENGKIDNRIYWRNVDEAFFSNFSEDPPFRITHRSREFLQKLRAKIQKQE